MNKKSTNPAQGDVEPGIEQPHDLENRPYEDR
jgi:hypothetical protein